MRDIEKLLRKISKKDRQTLLSVVDILLSKNHKGLVIKKLQGSDFYRLRKGQFRVILHYDDKNEIVLDSIRMRKEDTYKNL